MINHALGDEISVSVQFPKCGVCLMSTVTMYEMADGI